MNTLPVVPDFDVFENSLYGLLTRFELFQIDEFTLDDAVKRLDTRIIKTVAPRYIQHLAHLLNRKFGAVSVDELVPYFRSFMKMRAAFLRWHFPLAVRDSPVQDPAGPSHPA